MADPVLCHHAGGVARRELAENLERPWGEWLPRTALAADPPFVSGTTHVPPAFDGAIFLGLFPERMPVAEPLACPRRRQARQASDALDGAIAIEPPGRACAQN